MHVINQNNDGGASAPVGPSVATPLLTGQKCEIKGLPSIAI